MKNILIELKNVDIGYTKNILIKDVSIKIYKGDKILLMGPNGSGKSTFLKVITKLKKPINGKIYYGYHSISYVPQNKSITNFPIRIYDVLNMYFPLWYSKKEKSIKIESILKQMNLWEKRNLLLTECSGGELQRTLIARSLLYNPEILILDEPLNAIDIENRENFLQLLDTLYKELHLTIIMTSHDINQKLINFFCMFFYIKDQKLYIENYLESSKV